VPGANKNRASGRGDACLTVAAFFAVMASFVSVLKLVATRVARQRLDLAATGRPFVQATLGAGGRPRGPFRATLRREGNFTTFPAEEHVAATIDRHTAAEGRILVQAAIGTQSDPFLAGVLVTLDLATFAAERHFRIGIVRMGLANGRLTTARNYEPTGGQAQQGQAESSRHRQSLRIKRTKMKAKWNDRPKSAFLDALLSISQSAIGSNRLCVFAVRITPNLTCRGENLAGFVYNRNCDRPRQPNTQVFPYEFPAPNC
jgi:hypothetical protein